MTKYEILLYYYFFTVFFFFFLGTHLVKLFAYDFISGPAHGSGLAIQSYQPNEAGVVLTASLNSNGFKGTKPNANRFGFKCS